MRNKLLTLPLVLMLLIAQAAPITVQAAGGAPTLLLAGQIGGVSRVTAYSGGQMYTNFGPRVVRLPLPLTTTAAPSAPAAYSPVLPAIPQDLKVANGFVYVALGAYGVRVLNATSLAIVGAGALPSGSDPATALAVGPQSLYLAAGNTGIIVYSLVVDKAAPVRTQTFSGFASPQYLTDVETRSIRNNNVNVQQLYAASYNGDGTGSVYRFDISTNAKATTLTSPAATAPVLPINALAVGGSIIYAAGDDTLFGLDGWDLGASASLSESLPLATGGLQVALDPAEANVYLLNFSSAVEVVKAIPFQMLSTVPFTTTSSANSLVVLNYGTPVSNTLYMADGTAGLTLATAHTLTPAALSWVANPPEYLTPKPSTTTMVAGLDDQAYALSTNAENISDLWTLTTTVPASIGLLGPESTPQVQAINDMTLYGTTDLLVSAVNNGLLDYAINPAAEVTDPPTVITFTSSTDSVNQTVVTATTAVVAAGNTGLATVDLIAKEVIGRSSQPDTTSNVRWVDVDGNYAYTIDLMDHEGGSAPTLRVFDITTLDAPVEVGGGTVIDCGADPNAGAAGIKAAGNYVFIACSGGGVQVLPVTDPSGPTFGTAVNYPTLGVAQALAIFNSRLYVADGDAGVTLFDIAADGTLTRVANTKLPASADNLAVAPNGNVYVSMGDAGLAVLQPAEVVTYLPFIVR
jgi:hypothetical protein